MLSVGGRPLLLGATATLLLASALVAVPAAARAAVRTCHGRPATIVGSPNGGIEGTAGRDVIVTNGAHDVAAGDGDDLICITHGASGQNPHAKVMLADGGGDDVIDARASGVTVYVYLGRGADIFLGGPETDIVNDTCPVAYLPCSCDATADRIRTGRGHDEVDLVPASGADRIDLGPGSDAVMTYRNPHGGARIDGGPGQDEYLTSVDTPGHGQHSGNWLVDDRRGVITRDGVVRARIAGIEIFDLHGWTVHNLAFLGGPGPETFEYGLIQDNSYGGYTGDIRVAMGDGDDTVHTYDVQLRSVSGGPGEDVLELVGHTSIAVDLARHRFADGRPGSTIHGVEDLVAQGLEVFLAGDARANRFSVLADRATILGRGGDDVLLADPRSGPLTAYGGPGRDRSVADVSYHCESR